jgi:hypothetical protein
MSHDKAIMSSCCHPWITGTSTLELPADRNNAQTHVLWKYIWTWCLAHSCFLMFVQNNTLTTSPWNVGDILPRLQEGMPIWHAGYRGKPGRDQRQWFFQHGVWLPLPRRSDECVASVTILYKICCNTIARAPWYVQEGRCNWPPRAVVRLSVYASTSLPAVLGSVLVSKEFQDEREFIWNFEKKALGGS